MPDVGKLRKSPVSLAAKSGALERNAIRALEGDASTQFLLCWGGRSFSESNLAGVSWAGVWLGE
jgi:hypothetical protein